MSDRLSDRRRRVTRYWMDDELVDVMGAIIGPYGVTVYNVLSRHADGEGNSFPHVKTLARKGKMSERQAQVSLALMERCKMLTKTTRVDAKGSPTGNDYALLDVSEWVKLDGGGCITCTPLVQGLHQGGAGPAPPLKETQFKEFSSSEEEETFPETVAPAAAPKTPNAYTVYLDAWRAAFPGRPDPEVSGRHARGLKLRAQDLGAGPYQAGVLAYFASQHYQAIQGGHNVKTFLDWPADTWRGKTARPPARAGSGGGTLAEQEEEMRLMREAQDTAQKGGTE